VLYVFESEVGRQKSEVERKQSEQMGDNLQTSDFGLRTEYLTKYQFIQYLENIKQNSHK
jgi:hypothetical protein